MLHSLTAFNAKDDSQTQIIIIIIGHKVYSVGWIIIS